MRLFYAVVFILLITSIGMSHAKAPLTIQAVGLTVGTNIPESVSKSQNRTFNINVLNTTSSINSGTTCFLTIFNEGLNGTQIYFNSSSAFTNYDIQLGVDGQVHKN